MDFCGQCVRGLRRNMLIMSGWCCRGWWESQCTVATALRIRVCWHTTHTHLSTHHTYTVSYCVTVLDNCENYTSSFSCAASTVSQHRILNTDVALKDCYWLSSNTLAFAHFGFPKIKPIFLILPHTVQSHGLCGTWAWKSGDDLHSHFWNAN